MIDVAVKTLRPNSMSADDFLEEAKMMHKLRHSKLVLLMGVCTKAEPMYIITELMINGSLLEYLHKDAGTSLTLTMLVDMAAQVTAFIYYNGSFNTLHCIINLHIYVACYSTMLFCR